MAAGLVILVFLLVAEFCAGQNQDGCVGITTSCNDCIAFSEDCIWCSLPPDMPAIRCRNRTMSNADVCPPRLLENPESVFEITQNDTLGNATQVTPQNLRLELRRGIRKTFQMDVRPSRFAPFDIYFLMDLSQSLANDLDTIRSLTSDIADRLTLNSPSFGMGFGSFVDKTTLPYSLPTYMYITPQGVTDCLVGSACEDPYSFRHILSPTNEVQQFTDMLANVTVSVSSDNPEGGLDAMLQTAVCPEIIGWRDDSVLRMLMFITDAGYHVAGDGVLGGVVRPNDGRCHMELVNGIYENVAATIFDYPSIYQLNQLLAQENIIPIFAVDTEIVNEYQELARELSSTGAQVQSRQSDSADIVNVIQQSYNAARETVRVIPRQAPTGLSVSVTPLCNNITEDNGCAGVQLEEIVSFEVSVTLENCRLIDTPVDVTLSVPGFGSTVLTIIPVCTCDCSAEENWEPQSSLCTNGNGTVVCGTCVCNPGRSGRLCQCSPDQILQQCPPVGQMEKCFGRGTCNECNECECDLEPGTNRRYFGDACECDSSTCPVNTEQMSGFFNLTCSGGDRGECDCGTRGCVCRRAPMSNMPYFSVTGQPCGCDPDNCYNEDAATGRSGLCINTDRQGADGNCICTGCVCPEGFTDFNKTCIFEQTVCDRNTPCARCSQRQGATPTICDCNYTLVPRGTPPADYITCNITGENNCITNFYVASDSSQPILVEQEMTCPANNLGWIIGVSLIGGILLLGLLALIIIKIILVLLERVEYKKFTQQLQEAEWAPHENPLYVNPQQNYKNVLYKKRH